MRERWVMHAMPCHAQFDGDVVCGFCVSLRIIGLDTRVLGGKGLPKNILVIYAAKEGEGICTVGLFSLFIPWFELGLGRMDGWTGGWMGLAGAGWGIWSIWREEEKGASSRNIKKLLFACVVLEKAIRIHSSIAG